MGNKEREIRDRLRGKDHLLPVFTDVQGVCAAVNQYDPRMFVVFNCLSQKYELHSLDHKLNTLGFEIDNLDHRIINRIYNCDLRVHGRRVFDNLRAENARIKRDHDQKYRDWVRGDVADRLYGPVSRYAWGEA
jgi:hypothetical protein